MRKALTLLMISFCFLFSCKKDNEISKGPYLGTWELTKSLSNGVVGIFYYKEGNGNTISFDNSGNFTRTIVSIDTSYSNHYNYSLDKGKGSGCQVEETVPILNLSNGEVYIATIQDTLLSIRSRECIDLGTTNLYRKIQ